MIGQEMISMKIIISLTAKNNFENKTVKSGLFS